MSLSWRAPAEEHSNLREFRMRGFPGLIERVPAEVIRCHTDTERPAQRNVDVSPVALQQVVGTDAVDHVNVVQLVHQVEERAAAVGELQNASKVRSGSVVVIP